MHRVFLAADRSMTSSIGEAREAMSNVACDVIKAVSQNNAANRGSVLLIPPSLRLLPLYMLSMIKAVSGRIGPGSKKNDKLPMFLDRFSSGDKYKVGWSSVLSRSMQNFAYALSHTNFLSGPLSSSYNRRQGNSPSPTLLEDKQLSTSFRAEWFERAMKRFIFQNGCIFRFNTSIRMVLIFWMPMNTFICSLAKQSAIISCNKCSMSPHFRHCSRTQ